MARPDLSVDELTLGCGSVKLLEHRRRDIRIIVHGSIVERYSESSAVGIIPRSSNAGRLDPRSLDPTPRTDPTLAACAPLVVDAHASNAYGDRNERIQSRPPVPTVFTGRPGVNSYR